MIITSLHKTPLQTASRLLEVSSLWVALSLCAKFASRSSSPVCHLVTMLGRSSSNLKRHHTSRERCATSHLSSAALHIHPLSNDDVYFEQVFDDEYGVLQKLVCLVLGIPRLQESQHLPLGIERQAFGRNVTPLASTLPVCDMIIKLLRNHVFLRLCRCSSSSNSSNFTIPHSE